MAERLEVRFRFRRNAKARWEALNIVLGPGEPGIELSPVGQPDKLKLGDGITPWNELAYFTGGSGEFSDPELLAHINSSTPHPVYDEGPSLVNKYRNAKV